MIQRVHMYVYQSIIFICFVTVLKDGLIDACQDLETGSKIDESQCKNATIGDAGTSIMNGNQIQSQLNWLSCGFWFLLPKMW